MTDPPDHRRADALRRMSPLGGAHPTEPPPELPRMNIDAAPPPPRSWWRRLFAWVGLPVLGVGATMVPRPAMAPPVQMQVAPQRASPTLEGGTAEQIAALLARIDALERQASKPAASRTDEILSFIAGKAAELTIQSCMLVIAAGTIREAGRRAREHLARTTLFGATRAEHDPDDELRLAMFGLPAEDQATLALEPVPAPDDPAMLRLGQNIAAQLFDRLRPTLCAEKGIARAMVGDTTREIIKHIRKALFTGELSAGTALMVAGLAAVIAQQGLAEFCRAPAAR